MMPTALEMHKFTNIMQKDRALEEPRAYKVVTAIRSFKDKERLQYLLNNKLNAN